MEAFRKIKGFFARIGSGIAGFFRGAKSYSVRFFYFVKRMVGVTGRLLTAYWSSLHEHAQTRFLTMAWSFVIVFAALMILSGSNPFRLLIPGLTFRWPVQDARVPVRIFQVPRGTDAPVAMERRLLIEPSVERNAERVAVAISTMEEAEDDRSTIILEPLPDFGFALRKAWYREDRGELILDFRKRTIQEEIERFFRGRTDAGKKERGRILDLYFTALTQSIFSALPAPKTITYLVDGQNSPIEDMSYKLTEKKSR